MTKNRKTRNHCKAKSLKNGEPVATLAQVKEAKLRDTSFGKLLLSIRNRKEPWLRGNEGQLKSVAVVSSARR
jgi:hypothetical protein